MHLTYFFFSLLFVAPNAEHINKQDCAVKEKHSELFGCFDPGKNKEHNQYDLLDDRNLP